MNRRKKFITSLVLAALFAGIFALCYSLEITATDIENEFCCNVIRIHVLANSDSYEDQIAKERIKDAITPFVYTLVEKCAGIQEAESVITNNIHDICDVALRESSNLGYDYDIKAEFSRLYYSVRAVGDTTYPPGEYLSLRILIGEGEGKNWWSILFPNTFECKTYSEFGETVSDKNKTKIEFYFIDILNKVLKKDLE